MDPAVKLPGAGTQHAPPYGASDSIEMAAKRLCFIRRDDPMTAEVGLADVAASSGDSSGMASSPVRLEAHDPAEALSQAPSSATSALATPPACHSLDDLGPDLLLHVLRKAHPTAWDLCRMACVSRQWRQLCYSRVFWTKLRISSGSIRPGVESLAARCRDVVELHIDDPRCELFILHPILLACADTLQRVVINADKDATSRNEAAICSILWIISLHCKRVESVELLSDGVQGGFDYIDNKALWYLTTGFRNIRSFACLCKDSMTKQSLYLMVIAWRELSCLRVHAGQLLKEDLLCLRKCHNLRVLELAGGDLGRLMDADRPLSQGAHAPGGPPPPPTSASSLPPSSSSSSPLGGRGEAPEVVHAELEVLVLSSTAACPQHLAALVDGLPGLKRVLLNRGSWARGSPQQVQQLRKQFGALQHTLRRDRKVELLLEE